MLYLSDKNSPCQNCLSSVWDVVEMHYELRGALAKQSRAGKKRLASALSALSVNF